MTIYDTSSMKNHKDMDKNLFKGLNKQFDAGFTDEVMNRIMAESVAKSSASKVIRLISNWSVALAAASVLLFGVMSYSGGDFDIDQFMGLSEYSDFELGEMDYFFEE